MGLQLRRQRRAVRLEAVLELQDAMGEGDGDKGVSNVGWQVWRTLDGHEQRTLGVAPTACGDHVGAYADVD